MIPTDNPFLQNVFGPAAQAPAAPVPMPSGVPAFLAGIGPNHLNLLGALLARMGGSNPTLMQNFLNSPFYQARHPGLPTGVPGVPGGMPTAPGGPIMTPGGGGTGAPIQALPPVAAPGPIHPQAFAPSPMLPPNAATSLAGVAQQKAPGFGL